MSLSEDQQIVLNDLFGDVSDTGPSQADQIQAALFWEHQEPMVPGRRYLFQLDDQQTEVWISELKYRLDAGAPSGSTLKVLNRGDGAVANLSLEREVTFRPHTVGSTQGMFLLVDLASEEVVGRGYIRFALRRARNLTRHTLKIGKEDRATALGQRPRVIWLTGLSGAGKSTLADALETHLHDLGHHTYVLDGDNVRHGLNRDLGFTEADRVENIRRFAEVAKLFADAGLIVIVSVISPFRSEREMARHILDKGEFIEVFVDAPLDVCEERDPKGLYAKARRGEIVNFTGIDSPYEAPLKPELHIRTDQQSVDDAVESLMILIK